MRHLLAVVLLSVVWLPLAAQAEVVCDETHQRVCIETVSTDSTITFYAENRHKALPVTLDVSVTSTNLQRSGGSDRPVVLDGGERRKLFTLTAIRNAAWNYQYEFSWSRGDINAQHDTTHRYRLPFAEGAAFSVGQGCNGSFSHRGPLNFAVDFDMPEGTAIHAARAGRVVDLKENSRRGGADENFRNDGNYVIVSHSDGTMAQYFHLRRDGVAVELGQSVRRGEFLGYSGNTGQSTGPHLHFDVIKGAAGVESETVPFQFETASGVVECPQKGTRLTAVE